MQLAIYLECLEAIRLILVRSLSWEEFRLVDKEIGAGFCIPF